MLPVGLECKQEHSSIGKIHILGTLSNVLCLEIKGMCVLLSQTDRSKRQNGSEADSGTYGHSLCVSISSQWGREAVGTIG